MIRLPFAALALSFVMAGGASAQTATFDRFTYQGRSIEQVKPKAGEYLNPIISGYYPDPSVTRVGKDYYLVNSSFAHFPGLPIFHSTDLVHWTQLGNAIDRPGQLDFTGRSVSEAVFAPDISYHDGTFTSSTPASSAGAISSSPRRSRRGHGRIRSGCPLKESTRPSIGRATAPISSTTAPLMKRRVTTVTAPSGSRNMTGGRARWSARARSWSMAASTCRKSPSGSRGRISSRSTAGII